MRILNNLSLNNGATLETFHAGDILISIPQVLPGSNVSVISPIPFCASDWEVAAVTVQEGAYTGNNTYQFTTGDGNSITTKVHNYSADTVAAHRIKAGMLFIKRNASALVNLGRLPATTISASAFTAGYQPERAFNGYRHTNFNWGSGTPAQGGGWSVNNINVMSQWIEANFGTEKTVHEIKLFGLLQSINYNIDPHYTATSYYNIWGLRIYAWVNGAYEQIADMYDETSFVVHYFPFAQPLRTSKIKIELYRSQSSAGYLVECEIIGR